MCKGISKKGDRKISVLNVHPHVGSYLCYLFIHSILFRQMKLWNLFFFCKKVQTESEASGSSSSWIMTMARPGSRENAWSLHSAHRLFHLTACMWFFGRSKNLPKGWLYKTTIMQEQEHTHSQAMKETKYRLSPIHQLYCIEKYLWFFRQTTDKDNTRIVIFF